MSDTLQDAPDVDLRALDRHLRPLRRVLARVVRAGPGPHDPKNLARLLGRVLDLALPSAIAGVIEVLQDRMLAEEVDEDAFSDAWQQLHRLDATLGLPWSPPRLERVVRSLSVPDPEPELEDAGDDEAPADPGSDADARAVEWPTLRLDQLLSALPIPHRVVRVLEGVGVITVGDVLWRLPSTCREAEPVVGAGRELPEGEIAIGGRVRGRWTVCGPQADRRAYLRLRGADDAIVAWKEPLDAAWLSLLPMDARVVVLGTSEGGMVSQGRLAVIDGGRAVEMDYGLGEAEAAFRVVLDALIDAEHAPDEVLPSSVLARLGVPRLGDALRAVHRGQVELGRPRLAAEERMAEQLAQSWSRFRDGRARGIVHTILHDHISTHERTHPPLPDLAQRALEDIKRDLRQDLPMRRVVTGDASTGVDEIALRTLLMVAQSRSQVLVLCPDAESARVQHDLWESSLRGFGHVPSLLVVPPARSEVDALERGEVHVVFASPEVEATGLNFRRLGLVVADEHARPGALIAGLDARRGPHAGLLVMARTPVRDAALEGPYADFDLSDLGVDRGVASGGSLSISERDQAFAALGEAVVGGASVVVAFPLARTGGDLLDLEESGRLQSTLSAEVFGGASIGLYHGGLARADRSRALLDFLERRVRVLVATTRIELVGPMPRAIHVMVDHADHVDMERLLGLRAMATPEGRMHYVVSDEGERQGASRDLISPLVSGASDREITRMGEEPGDGRSWRWVDAEDAALAREVRGVVHQMLVADANLRDGFHARLHRRLHQVWTSQQTDAPPWPVPRKQGSTNRRRRRRRRRR